MFEWEQTLCVGDQHGNNRDSSVSDALVSTPIHPIHAYEQKKPSRYFWGGGGERKRGGGGCPFFWGGGGK